MSRIECGAAYAAKNPVAYVCTVGVYSRTVAPILTTSNHSFIAILINGS